MAWDEQDAFRDYRDRSEGPGSFGGVMVVLLCLAGLAYWMIGAGVMDTPHTYEAHADGDLGVVFETLIAFRDGASRPANVADDACMGGCAALLSDLGGLPDEDRAQLAGCVGEDDALSVRRRTGDFTTRIGLELTCGGGELWSVELENDAPDGALAGSEDAPTNWRLARVRRSAN